MCCTWDFISLCPDLHLTQNPGQSVPPPTLLAHSLQSLSRAAGRPDWDSTQDVDVPLLQHSLSLTIDEATFDILRASATHLRQKVLMLSTSIRHAGDWLNVVPSSALGLHLQDQEFHLCLKYWLGLQIFEEHQKCPVCLTLADRFGDHYVGCGGNADIIFRHNSLRDAVFSVAALVPRKEVPSLIPGSQHRPADVYLPGGRPAALDITVISTMQPSTIQPAAGSEGHALLVAETRKFATHGPACQAAGISCIPLAIETLGCLSDATAETISGIDRLIGQRFGVSPHESSRHLFQRLAISLWKGNATAWIHRCLPPAPNVDGVV